MSVAQSPTTARAQEQRGTSTSAYALFFGTWQLATYYWIAVVLISAAVTVMINTWDEVGGSIADGILGSVPFFLAVMGIIIPLGTLPLHVAGGGTRRSLFRGTVAATVALGVSMGLVGAFGMLVEYGVFAALDWPGTVEPAGLYDSSGDFFGIWLSWSLSGIGYFLGGAAVALGYYRWGPMLGTVVMLPIVALVIGGEIALGGGITSTDLGGLDGDSTLPAAASVALSLLASGGVALILHRTLRDLPLRANNST